MNNYCTLFNSNYLPRGLLMYKSLIDYQPNAHLFIFPFDEECCAILEEMNLSNATIVSLREFENETLLNLKKNRTMTEYCWTCTPWIIDYVFRYFKVDSCTYIDADIYFFGDSSVLIQEMPSRFSVLITPHRYSEEYNQAETSGIFCVQYLYFKNNFDGKEVLGWWKDACTDWCFNRLEDGKFGDQKYLDDWPQRFVDKIWILQNKGGGVAPWNLQQYEFKIHNRKIKGVEKTSKEIFEVIFFHFHACSLKKHFGLFNENIFLNYFSGYNLTLSSIECFYKPYEKMLVRESLFLKKNYSLTINFSNETSFNICGFLNSKFKRLFFN